MTRLSILLQVMAVGAVLALSIGRTPAVAANHPGECGEFKYWHHGHCEDARLKASDKPWTAGVF